MQDITEILGKKSKKAAFWATAEEKLKAESESWSAVIAVGLLSNE